MKEIQPEYSLLFNGISDVIDYLQQLQQKAEEQYSRQSGRIIPFPLGKEQS